MKATSLSADGLTIDGEPVELRFPSHKLGYLLAVLDEPRTTSWLVHAVGVLSRDVTATLALLAGVGWVQEYSDGTWRRTDAIPSESLRYALDIRSGKERERAAHRERFGGPAPATRSKDRQPQQPVIVVTMDSLPGMEIQRTMGIVTGTAIHGLGMVRDLAAGIRDVTGGRSATYERGVEQAQREALSELTTAAGKMGATGVVGLRYQVDDVGGSMLLAFCYGTAVLAAKRDPDPVPVDADAAH